MSRTPANLSELERFLGDRASFKDIVRIILDEIRDLPNIEQAATIIRALAIHWYTAEYGEEECRGLMKLASDAVRKEMDRRAKS